MKRLIVLALWTSVIFGQDGAQLFKTHCARCHDSPIGRVPATSTLRAISSEAILKALDDGVMKTQAAGLTEPQRMAVAAYLGSQRHEMTITENACPAGEQNPGALSQMSWSSWGANTSNTRFQTSEAAGITASQAPSLKLKWAFNLGAGAVPRSQPAIAGNRIYVGADGGKVYALDSRSGCTYWMFETDNPVRSGMVVGPEALYFGDQKANLYAVSRASGKLLWKTHAEEHFAAVITAAPALSEGVLYAGVSSYEEVMGADPKYSLLHVPWKRDRVECVDRCANLADVHHCGRRKKYARAFGSRSVVNPDH